MPREFNAHPVIFDEKNNIFDERGNKFSALRKIAWVNNDEDLNDKDTYEKYKEKAKFEIRNWTVDESGKEIAAKGFTFLNPEGPNALVSAMIHEGFGDTKEVLKELRTRPDFKEAVETINDTESVGDGEYFDMRSLLLDESTDDEDNDDKEDLAS